MVRIVIQVAPLCITFVAAVFLARSTLQMKVENIAWIPQNTLALIQNLSYQKADTLIGSILLFTAFILQMLNLTLATEIGEFSGIPITVALEAIIYTVTLFVICHLFAEYLRNNFYSRAVASLRSK